jgi:5-formyltetrahydrofolate cyclo-ligase
MTVRMDSPRHLRSRIRSERTRLPMWQRTQLAVGASRVFVRTTLFRRSRSLACYVAHRGEMDPMPLVRRAWRVGKRVYLPVLPALDGCRLWFAPYEPGDRLLPNRFGIPEPDKPLRLMRRAAQLDLILAPVVAFDGCGNRLGTGGGFYDRSLAFLVRRSHWRRPRVVGLAYAFQEVPGLPVEPWDVPLDGVITEKCFRRLHQGCTPTPRAATTDGGCNTG